LLLPFQVIVLGTPLGLLDPPVTFPGTPGHLRAWFSQVKRMKPAL
jgi:hypothetical protein